MAEGTIDTLIIEVEFGGESGQKGMDKLISTLERLDNISKKVDRNTDKLSNRISKISKNARSYYETIKRVTNVLGKWFKKSNEYVESLNLFNVAMGKSADAAMKYARTVEAAMGIDITEWLEYQGAFNQLAEGYGLTSKTSNMMSKNLTQLAYDLSSLWNVNVSTAFLRLQSGMSGQIKGLKTWGINVSVASLKETALAHGIELSTAKMTEAQKATLRYITIMETTSKVQGDLARTIATPANALRILKAQWEQAQRAMGQVVSVIAVKVIPIFQGLVLAIKDTASALATMLGYELPNIDITDTFDTGTSSVDEFGDSLEDAEDTMSKLKKSLLGIDEINVLGDKSVIGLGGGYTADFGLDLSKYNYDFMKNLSTEGNKWYGVFKSIATTLADIVSYLWDIKGVLVAGALVPTFITFGETWKKITGGNGMKGLAANIGKLSGSSKDLNSKLTTLSKRLIGTGGIVAGFFAAKNGAYGLTKALSSDSNEGLGKSIASLITGGVAAVAGGFMIGGPVGALVGGLFALAGAALGADNANEELRKEIANSAYMNDARTSLSELAKSFKSTWGEAETLGTKSSNAMAAIKESVQKVSEARSLLQPYINKIQETGRITDKEADLMSGYVTTMVDELNYQMTTRVESIFDTFNGLVKLAGGNFEEELGGMKSDFLEFQALFGGVAAGHQTAIEGLLSLATTQNGLNDTQRAELQDHVNALAALDVTISSEKFTFDQLVADATKGFSITSVEDAQSILSNLATVASAYQTSLTSAYNEANVNIATLMARNDAMYNNKSIDKSQYEYFKQAFSSAKTDLAAAYNAANSTLSSDVEKIANAIQLGSINLLDDVVAELRKDYAAASDWEKSPYNIFSRFSGGEGSYINQGVKDVMKGTVMPIHDEVEKMLASFNIQQSPWFGEAIVDIMSTVFPNANRAGQDRYEYAVPMEEAIRRVLGKLGFYASGGFPDVGEMFVAREAGPELVGRIGNRSAVVNNEQIVEGIKRGVKEANQETGAGGDWIIQVVTPDGDVQSETIITAAERRNRRDGRTIIPIGT